MYCLMKGGSLIHHDWMCIINLELCIFKGDIEIYSLGKAKGISVAHDWLLITAMMSG